MLSLAGILVASLINILNYNFFSFNKINLSLYFFSFLINKKWYIDTLYNRIIVKFLLNFGYLISFKLLDRGFIELCGPVGISVFIKRCSLTFSNFQTGQITHYLFFMVLGLVFFCFLNFFLWKVSFIIDFSLYIIFFILISFS